MKYQIPEQETFTTLDKESKQVMSILISMLKDMDYQERCRACIDFTALLTKTDGEAMAIGRSLIITIIGSSFDHNDNDIVKMNLEHIMTGVKQHRDIVKNEFS